MTLSPSNAPAKLRRACAAYHSATDLPRAASFSRLLDGTCLFAAGPPKNGSHSNHQKRDGEERHDDAQEP